MTQREVGDYLVSGSAVQVNQPGSKYDGHWSAKVSIFNQRTSTDQLVELNAYFVEREVAENSALVHGVRMVEGKVSGLNV